MEKPKYFWVCMTTSSEETKTIYTEGTFPSNEEGDERSILFLDEIITEAITKEGFREGSITGEETYWGLRVLHQPQTQEHRSYFRADEEDFRIGHYFPFKDHVRSDKSYSQRNNP